MGRYRTCSISGPRRIGLSVGLVEKMNKYSLFSFLSYYILISTILSGTYGQGMKIFTSPCSGPGDGPYTDCAKEFTENQACMACNDPDNTGLCLHKWWPKDLVGMFCGKLIAMKQMKMPPKQMKMPPKTKK